MISKVMAATAFETNDVAASDPSYFLHIGDGR